MHVVALGLLAVASLAITAAQVVALAWSEPPPAQIVRVSPCCDHGVDLSGLEGIGAEARSLLAVAADERDPVARSRAMTRTHDLLLRATLWRRTHACAEDVAPCLDCLLLAEIVDELARAWALNDRWARTYRE